MAYWQLRAEASSGAVFSCGVRACDRPGAEEAARDKLPSSFLLAPVWLVVTELSLPEAQAPQSS